MSNDDDTFKDSRQDEENQENQSLDLILGGRYVKGKKRKEGLARLAAIMMELQSGLDFKQGTRDWCYFLEGRHTIQKGEFDRGEESIVDARKLGLFPDGFFADDEKREWHVVEIPTDEEPAQYFCQMLGDALDFLEYRKKDWWKGSLKYVFDWWEGEKYYIQTGVEKKGLKSLFKPVSENFHTPIADIGGQPELNMRLYMAQRYKWAWENRGQIGVFLTCFDADPWGIKLARGWVEKHIESIKDMTGYWPTIITADEYESHKNAYDKYVEDSIKEYIEKGHKIQNPPLLIIDRFGLNDDFIEQNQLVAIDNLITSENKDLSKSYYCYRCELQCPKVPGQIHCRQCGHKLYMMGEDPDVKEWIAKHGMRKWEANSAMKVPQAARELYQNAIQKYLGPDALSRFEGKEKAIKDKFEQFRKKHKRLFTEMEKVAERYDGDE